MNIHHFTKQTDKKIFPQFQDDIDKRTPVHQEIQNLNLPAHLSVDIIGDMLILHGNVINRDAKDKIIETLGAIDGIATIHEDIITGDGL